MIMAEAVGDEWVYVLSQQEAVTSNAITAMAVGVDENNKPSKNADVDGETAAAQEEVKELNAAAGDEKTSAQETPSELDNKAAPSSSSESKDGGGGARSHSDSDDEAEYPDWYTPEEVEVEKAYDAYMAALDRARGFACKLDDDLVEIEMDTAFAAYVAALDRRAAAKIDGSLIDSRLIDEALRTYRAACKRAAKILGAGAGAASSSNAGGGRCPRAVVEKENPRYDDPYNDDGDTYGGSEPAGQSYRGYGGGSSAPASLGPLGSSYDYSYYNRYDGFGFPSAYGSVSGYGYEYYDGYGFPGAYGAATRYDYGFGYPGAAYGPATSYGYDGYGGYAEPYASYLPPGYQTTAVYLAPPPPALDATTSFYPPAPWAMPYVNMTPASYVPPWLQQLRDSARADEPSAPAVAAPTTTQPQPQPSCSWD